MRDFMNRSNEEERDQRTGRYSHPGEKRVTGTRLLTKWWQKQ